jgi:hypothetical protein
MTTLVPAYGRDYKSKKAVLADLDAERDFIIADMFDPYDGKPCTPRRDFAGKTVKFRYNGLRSVMVVKL